MFSGLHLRGCPYVTSPGLRLRASRHRSCSTDDNHLGTIINRRTLSDKVPRQGGMYATPDSSPGRGKNLSRTIRPNQHGDQVASRRCAAGRTRGTPRAWACFCLRVLFRQRLVGLIPIGDGRLCGRCSNCGDRGCLGAAPIPGGHGRVRELVL